MDQTRGPRRPAPGRQHYAGRVRTRRRPAGGGPAVARGRQQGRGAVHDGAAGADLRRRPGRRRSNGRAGGPVPASRLPQHPPRLGRGPGRGVQLRPPARRRTPAGQDRPRRRLRPVPARTPVSGRPAVEVGHRASASCRPAPASTATPSRPGFCPNRRSSASPGPSCRPSRPRVGLGPVEMSSPAQKPTKITSELRAGVRRGAGCCRRARTLSVFDNRLRQQEARRISIGPLSWASPERSRFAPMVDHLRRHGPAFPADSGVNCRCHDSQNHEDDVHFVRSRRVGPRSVIKPNAHNEHGCAKCDEQKHAEFKDESQRTPNDQLPTSIGSNHGHVIPTLQVPPNSPLSLIH